jgi:hypothetical protein
MQAQNVPRINQLTVTAANAAGRVFLVLAVFDSSDDNCRDAYAVSGNSIQANTPSNASATMVNIGGTTSRP